MEKVFISGSIQIKRLDSAVLERLDNVVKSGFHVIVGDANGVDSSIQRHLHAVSYPNVTVYSSSAVPRNNIGNWAVKRVKTNAKPGTRAFFTAKDIAMADACDYGYMVWDSKSTGTLSNTIELLAQKKASLVYLNSEKTFKKIKTVDDLEELVEYMSQDSLSTANVKISLDDKIQLLKIGQGSFL